MVNFYSYNKKYFSFKWLKSWFESLHILLFNIVFLIMDKVNLYISKIIESKWWKENLFWRPTDIIWFNDFWQELSFALVDYVSKKEICFFDENIKNSDVFHYLDFFDMFEKSELMIFTTEIDEKYFFDLSRLNKNVTLVLDKSFVSLINILKDKWFSNNLLII